MLHRYRAGLLVFALIVTGHVSGLFDPFHRLTSDQRFAAYSRAPTETIVVVDIDSKSIRAIGQWPWPRSVHAAIVNKLVAAHVKEIALDIDFSSRSVPKEDAALEAALQAAGGIVVLAAFDQHATGGDHDAHVVSTLPLQRFSRHGWVASVNIRADADSLIRTFPLGSSLDGTFVFSMPAMLAGVQHPSQQALAIDFSIDTRRIDRISAIDIVRGNTDPGRLRGKSVIVGAQAAELRDIFAVPRYGYLSGPMLQALSAETLLQSRALQHVGLPVLLLGLGLVIALAQQIVARLRWKIAISLLIGLALTLEAGATVLQIIRPVVLNAVMWQGALLAYCAIALIRQIDINRILLFISRNQAENTQRILDQVISDNFDGVIVTDGHGIIKAMSRSAGKALPIDADALKIGHNVAAVVPRAFADSIRSAVQDFQAGRWTPSQPQLTRHYHNDRRQRIMEHVVTPSMLKGGVSLTGTPIPDSIVICLTFRDITDRWRAEQRLKFLARFDPLTGLPNKNRFADMAAAAMEAAGHEKKAFVLISIHLSRVDVINDTLGHEYGEQIVKVAAGRLRHIVIKGDIIGYLGGHQFIVLAGRDNAADSIVSLIERIIDELSATYEFDLHHAVVGVSAGAARLDTDRGRCAAGATDTAGHDGADANGADSDPDSGSDSGPDPDMKTYLDRKIRHADMALMRARAEHGNVYRFFDPEMEAKLHHHQLIELDLVRALKNEEFEVFYQPQIDLRNGTVVGAEALVRWRHPQKGYISPAEFLPVAEVTGHIVDIGAWVLRQACVDARNWPVAAKIAVNVSPAQFTDGNFVNTVRGALKTSRLAPQQLDLEVTESLFIENNDIVIAVMNTLREDGIRFALDDFGTGYSSLSYIESFPIDKIKVDQSFVFGITDNPKSLAIVQAVTMLSRHLGLTTIVEGVEKEEQLKLLRLAGCAIGQGYLFSRPISNSEMIAYLQKTATVQTADIQHSA